jgi:hypothetical protein
VLPLGRHRRAVMAVHSAAEIAAGVADFGVVEGFEEELKLSGRCGFGVLEEADMVDVFEQDVGEGGEVVVVSAAGYMAVGFFEDVGLVDVQVRSRARRTTAGCNGTARRSTPHRG